MADNLSNKKPQENGSVSASAPKQQPAAPTVGGNNNSSKFSTPKQQPTNSEAVSKGFQKSFDKFSNGFNSGKASKKESWIRDPDNPRRMVSPAQFKKEQAERKKIIEPKQTAPKQQKMPNAQPDATQKKIMNQGFAPKQNPVNAKQKKAWDINNNPGSAVTTKELEDFTRGYLKKSGGLSDDYINKTVSGLSQNSRQADFYKQKMKDAYEREQASDMFGVDLNKEETPKKSGHDFDSLSKELDSGKTVNIDAGLLPYEHGFETSGNEDLAIDARKNEDGKYDLYMYPETENGPVSGYEEPAYTFDTFDELKSFVENGYKQSEQSEREQASKLYGTDLNKPEDNNENIGFESDNEQDMNLYDFARGLGHDDATARTLVAHYKEGGDFAGVPRWKLEEIANGTADKNRWPFK